MKEIDLITSLKTKKEFFESFQEGDQLKCFRGRSLIFPAVSNKNLESRYEICDFLLDKKVDVTCLNEENESVLHILLVQVKNDVIQTTKLCQRLISTGADINVLDSKNRVAFKYVINMKYTDEELKPLYDLWFSQPYVNLITKDNWGLTPIEFAGKFPYRKDLVKRMSDYVKEQKG